MRVPEPLLPPHVLAARLRNLNREVHASMPCGYRVASLLVHLASDSLDAFGRVSYALMIEAVVRGMPDSPNGKPATDYVQDVHQRGPDALPSGYGRPFAARVYRILLAKFGAPEVAEEAMSKVMVQAARGKLHVANGSGLHAAEAYLITSAMNAARDILRSQGRRREESLTQHRDDDDVVVDVEDPEAFVELERALSPGDIKKLLGDLEQVHPRARSFAEALLEGDSKADIAEAWSVTPSYVSKWLRQYGSEIKQVIEHHLRQARGLYSYDRRDSAGPL